MESQLAPPDNTLDVPFISQWTTTCKNPFKGALSIPDILTIAYQVFKEALSDPNSPAHEIANRYNSSQDPDCKLVVRAMEEVSYYHSYLRKNEPRQDNGGYIYLRGRFYYNGLDNIDGLTPHHLAAMLILDFILFKKEMEEKGKAQLSTIIQDKIGNCMNELALTYVESLQLQEYLVAVTKGIYPKNPEPVPQ